MNVDDALRDLLPILYAAPVEPAKWRAFLHRLCQLTEISSGFLVASRPASGNACLAGAGAEHDPAAIELYNRRYGEHDPFRAAFLKRGKVGVIDGEELVSRAELVKTELWNEVLSPYGLHHVTMLCGNCDATGIETLSLWRNATQGPLSLASLKLLEALTPHVQTMLRLNARLQVADSCGSLSETALGALDVMVVLVDGRRRVQYMNFNAAQRLPSLIGMTIRRGRLVTSDAADDSQLEELVRRATAASTSGGSESGGAMKIRHPESPGYLQISVTPASELPHMAERDRCATIFIAEPQAAPRPRGELLREVYRLTATEARLADRLLEGKDLRDAAQHLSMTWSTARFHLKRVFAKTGTCRQSELMRLMLSLPSRAD